MKINIIVSCALSLIIISSCQYLPSIPGNQTSQKNRFENDKSNIRKEVLLNIPYRTLDTSKSITTFAFGSCNDQNQPQPLWKLIRSKNPQLMIMMGDNVYASKPETQPIIDQYIKLNQNKDYLALRESVPFFATWDDHDYGQQDGGADNPEKNEARRVFVNYWTYIKNLIPRTQSAIYHSRIVGDKNRRIQFILLDTRTDRSPLVPYVEPTAPSSPVPEAATADASVPNVIVVKSPTPLLPKVPRFYSPNNDPKANLLSEAQWKWLEAELKKPAELRILVSSIQFIADDHGFEKWGNFPLEKKRLLDLLDRNRIKNLVILSGDRHLSSIAQLQTKNQTLYDITSSGLNKPSPAAQPEVDQLYTAPSFLKINFGLAEVDWVRKQVLFQIIDAQDKPQLTQTIRF